ncbi:MAG: FG-GAP-like repeat-containing protein [Calditrichia bacterium]
MSDSSTIRYFPGWEAAQLLEIHVLDENYAVALGKYALLEWDGQNWKKLKPLFSDNSSTYQSLKINGYQNFYYTYSSDGINHQPYLAQYKNGQWERIKTEQPYRLDKLSLTSANSLWAVGNWGSMIHYFDGYSKNILTPRFAMPLGIWSFADTSIALLHLDEINGKTIRLSEFKNRTWTTSLFADGYHQGSLFLTPDSAWMVKDKTLFKYSNNTLRQIGEQKFFGQKADLFTFDDTLLVSSVGKLARYKDEVLIDTLLLEESRFFPINPQEYFLINARRTLAYWGPKPIGDPNFKHRANFSWHQNNDGPSHHLSIATLEMPNQKEIHFLISPDETIKRFIPAPKKNSSLWGLKNVPLPSGLEGYAGHEFIEDKPNINGGIFFADIDGDKDHDAILTALRGKTRLLQNIENQKFVDVSENFDFNLAGRIVGVQLADFDRDSNLDFVASDESNGSTIYLGDGYFRFDSTRVMPELKSGFSSVSDIDLDGFPDILTYGNHAPPSLFLNLGKNTDGKWVGFKDITHLSPAIASELNVYVQSVEWVDYDQDEDEDALIINRRRPLRLFENRRNGYFTDVTDSLGLGIVRSPYGANWADFDGDGDLDFFLSNLHRNYLFWNDSTKGFIVDSISLEDNRIKYSTGSVIIDVNNDGRPDILVANSEVGASGFYINEGPASETITIRVDGGIGNRSGIGTKISIFAEENNRLLHYEEIRTTTGYNSTKPAQINFSSKYQKLKAIAIFPSGERQEHRFTLNDQHIIFTQSKSIFAEVWVQIRPHFHFPWKLIATLLAFLFIGLLAGLRKRLLWTLNIRRPESNFTFLTILGLLALLISWVYLGPLPLLYFLIGVITTFLITRFLFTKYLERKYTIDLFPILSKLEHFRHSKSVSNNLDHLSFLSLEGEKEKYDKELITDVKEEIYFFKTESEPLLQQIAIQLHQHKIPYALYHRFYHSRQQLQQLLKECKKSPESLFYSANSECIEALRSTIKDIDETLIKRVSSNLLDCLDQAISRLPELAQVKVVNPKQKKNIRVNISKIDLLLTLENLLQNSLAAVKDKTPEINIRIDYTGSYCDLFISDNGMGIAPLLQKKIFDKYVSSKGSTGLGLFLVRETVNKYSGSIELLDSTDRGTTMKLRLRVLK